jgi:hypothetical protein
MRRKTAPEDSVHPEASRAVASEVGLIAKAEEGGQSAMGEYVLDNRSHRTTQGSGVRDRRESLSSARKHARPRIPCSRLLGGRKTPRHLMTASFSPNLPPPAAVGEVQSGYTSHTTQVHRFPSGRS